MNGTCSTHGRDEKCKQYFSLNVKRSDHLEDVSVDGTIILELILGKWGGKVWTEFTWHRM
jgi:hypothetical protein